MGVIEQPVNTPEAWSQRAAEHVEPWLACGWSQSGQLERLRAVVDALDPKRGERLLDWGCGTGALCELLPADVDYLGFDWARGMIERATASHGRRFTTVPPANHWRFELVACVGPFNLPERWSKQHTWHTLRHLWDTTGCRTLAASLYSGDDEHCLRYTLAELEAFGEQLAWNVEVRSIRANDLLLVVRR